MNLLLPENGPVESGRRLCVHLAPAVTLEQAGAEYLVLCPPAVHRLTGASADVLRRVLEADGRPAWWAPADLDALTAMVRLGLVGVDRPSLLLDRRAVVTAAALGVVTMMLPAAAAAVSVEVESAGAPTTTTTTTLVPTTTTLAPGTVIATGGTESTVDIGGVSYQLHTFTDSTAASTFTLNFDYDIDYLVVGGGGAGGSAPPSTGAGGGGGGGGQVLYGSFTGLSAQSYTVMVGARGATGSAVGLDSSFAGVVAYGGGSGGGSGADDASKNGANGGGGFGGTSGPGSQGLHASTGQPGGYPGGAGLDGGIPDYGGGGGGAGEAGGVAVAGLGGSGGDGITHDITGTPTYYGAGGAGSGSADHGLGFGNPGSGGPGGGRSILGADGVVIIRYRLP